MLRAYVEVFGEAAAATAQAAADAAHSPTAEAAALPGVPARLAGVHRALPSRRA